MTQQTKNTPTVDSLTEKFESNLSQQITEYELLQSMYPNPGEIVLTDKYILKEIQTFLDKKSEYIPSRLDFVLTLCIEKSMKLEVCINLPTEYPDKEPDIYVRCNQLNRQQESKLNSDLDEYVKQTHVKGEVCLYTIISWLQEKTENIKIETVELVRQTSTDSDKSKVEDDKFQRIWIFSHHIYSKKKIEEIIKTAKDVCATGFCLPGKPGVICIEGESFSCMESWKTIKSMNWKKIMIRKTETFPLVDAKSVRKFTNFTELSFNMAEFSKYMNELGLSSIFNEFFGLGHES